MNIEFKGTPGPWLFRPKSNGVFTAPPAGSVYRYGSLIFQFDDVAEPSDEDLALVLAAPKLLEALRRMLDLECPLTGDPSRERLIEHWEYEQSQGNGAAEYHLFAWSVIAEALGE